MTHMLIRVGWKDSFVSKSVPILPISGWMGDNLIKTSTNMGWWKGKEVETMDGRKVTVSGGTHCVPPPPPQRQMSYVGPLILSTAGLQLYLCT